MKKESIKLFTVFHHEADRCVGNEFITDKEREWWKGYKQAVKEIEYSVSRTMFNRIKKARKKEDVKKELEWLLEYLREL